MRIRAGVAGLVVLSGCGSAAAAPAGRMPSSVARPPSSVAVSGHTAAAAVARQAAGQLITVIAPSYRATRAELTAYRRVDGRWQRVFGPWAAWIGRSGMASPGAKREGDGRTPSGTFGFSY